MTSSRNRRAWSIDSIVYRYFQIRSAGPPSTTINLSGVDTGNPERPPKWLMRLCDVGISIEKLTPPQKEAVIERWEAVIGQDDAARDLTVLDMRQSRVRRRGGDWRRVDEDKEMMRGRYEACRIIRRRVERTQAYRDGMDALEEVLGVSDE